jgi:putative photosynthetic complex assembly protein 2
MATLGLPIFYTLLLWWLSTCVILHLDSLDSRTFRWSMIGATAILALSLWGIAKTSADATLGGAYGAFAFGLLVWGWQLISFYMGYITGPRTTAYDGELSGWRRFVEAARTSLYHELAVCLSASIIAALTWDMPNKMGLWTFLLLWWMHLSAKLNIYCGVPNLSEELLPQHLHYLKSFMRRKPMNLFFPLSVSISTVIAVFLAQGVANAQATPFDTTCGIMLATLMALAIAEHWLLVAPLQTDIIWRWCVGVGSIEDGVASSQSAKPDASTLSDGDAPLILGATLAERSSDSDNHSMAAGVSSRLSWSAHPPTICDLVELNSVPSWRDAVGSAVWKA